MSPTKQKTKPVLTNQKRRKELVTLFVMALTQRSMALAVPSDSRVKKLSVSGESLEKSP